jgi:hypothetical protein
MSDSYELALWNGNYGLTAVFTIEVVIKLWGFGFWDYIRDGFNVFDFIIVSISWAEIILVSIAGMNALRCARGSARHRKGPSI